MNEDFGMYSQIVNAPGQEGPPFTDQEMWFAQFDQGPSGASAVMPLHMRSNPAMSHVSHNPTMMMANPTESDFSTLFSSPTVWWQEQSTGMKVAVVGGGVAALAGIAYLLMRKK